MKMIYVQSEAMSAIGYDETTKKLSIQFQQGKTYDFFNVPKHVYDGLRQAIGWHGEYYNKYIRGNYKC